MTEDLRYPVGKFQRPQSLSDAERDAAVESIAAAPTRLRAAVRGLSETQLDTPYRPDGWTVRQGAGFTVAIPPDWQTRPPDQRAAKDAALEVGIPFTGQPSPPPRLIVFVEQQQVGPLSVREPLLRDTLSAVEVLLRPRFPVRARFVFARRVST